MSPGERVDKTCSPLLFLDHSRYSPPFYLSKQGIRTVLRGFPGTSEKILHLCLRARFHRPSRMGGLTTRPTPSGGGSTHGSGRGRSVGHGVVGSIRYRSDGGIVSSLTQATLSCSWVSMSFFDRKRRSTPWSLAPLNFAPQTLAPWRDTTPWKSAPSRLACMRSTFWRSAPWNLAPRRQAPRRLAPICIKLTKE